MDPLKGSNLLVKIKKNRQGLLVIQYKCRVSFVRSVRVFHAFKGSTTMFVTREGGHNEPVCIFILLTLLGHLEILPYLQTNLITFTKVLLQERHMGPGIKGEQL